MNLSRIHRLLKLIGLLQAGKGYNIERLATACRVSRRTIFRDLDLLRQSGVPLHFDQQSQQYRIPGTYYLPPTNFTPEEALALIVLCHELGDRLPFFGPAHGAAVKLENSLPLRLREQMRRAADAVSIHPPPSNPLDGRTPVYQQLVEAVSARRCVRICYNSLAERKVILTLLHPYRLLFCQRSWYVIGRSSIHRGTRTFNLGRILSLDLLEDNYRIPRGFSLDRYLRNAWRLIPERGPDREVVVRFAPMVADNVAEVAWHKTQRVERNDDGTLDFHVTVSGLQEIPGGSWAMATRPKCSSPWNFAAWWPPAPSAWPSATARMSRSRPPWLPRPRG